MRWDGPSVAGGRLWGLSLPEPSYAQIAELSSAGLDLLARIQDSRELCDRLRRLGEDATGDAFVHGDVRWDNCLEFAPAGSRRRTGVLLIDWELAGRGDGAEDLGAAFGEHLRLWVDSIPKLAGSDVLRFAHRAGHPLDRLQPSMRALWDGYRRASASPPAPARVAEFAALRLLQAAMEYAQGLPRATGDVVALVQVADNMLRGPENAARMLLGLPA